MPDKLQDTSRARIALGTFGSGSFILGIILEILNIDWSKLAQLLVGSGVFLVLIAFLLPWLDSFRFKGPGGLELKVVLTPSDKSANDHDLLTGVRKELRGADPATSYADEFKEVIEGGSLDVLVINLGAGRAWLSSRLYLFVNVLVEVRGLKAVVFTVRPGSKDRFVGVCSASVVSSRLAWAFPWLPNALFDAWAETQTTKGEPHLRMNNIIRDASTLYKEYVRNLVAPGTDPERPRPLPDPLDREPPRPLPDQLDRDKNWAYIGNPEQKWDQWEHAKWVDDAFVKWLLNDDMTTDYVVGPPDDDKTIRAALAKPSPQYIAVLTDDLEFSRLVDRSRLLPQLSDIAAKSRR